MSLSKKSVAVFFFCVHISHYVQSAYLKYLLDRRSELKVHIFLLAIIFLFFFLLVYRRNKYLQAIAVQYKWHHFSHAQCGQLSATFWTVAHQAPLFIGFPRQEY